MKIESLYGSWKHYPALEIKFISRGGPAVTWSPQIAFSGTTPDTTDSEKEFVVHVKIILDNMTACSSGQVGVA